MLHAILFSQNSMCNLIVKKLEFNHYNIMKYVLYHKFLNIGLHVEALIICIKDMNFQQYS